MESALAITMLDRGRLLMAEQNALRFYEKINYLDEYEGVVLNKELAMPIANSLVDADILFLANHGIIVTGKTVYEAWESLYFLEKACRAQILAMSSGKPIKIIEDKIAKKVVEQIEKENMGNSANSFRHFEALKRLLVNEGSADFMD